MPCTCDRSCVPAMQMPPRRLDNCGPGLPATSALKWPLPASDALVVISGSRRRLGDCAEELANLLVQEKLAGASLLVLANKQVR